MSFLHCVTGAPLRHRNVGIIVSNVTTPLRTIRLCFANDGSNSRGSQPIYVKNQCSALRSGAVHQEAEPQDHSLPVSGEIALFRAVIMQALLDSVSQSKRTEDRVAKRQALEWFSSSNPDFIAVCQIAQLNHKWVLEQSIAAIARGCKRSSGKQSKASTGIARGEKKFSK